MSFSGLGLPITPPFAALHYHASGQQRGSSLVNRDQSPGAGRLQGPDFGMDYFDALHRWAAPQTSDGHENTKCSECKVLRSIVHSNGIQDTKLEVHCNKEDAYHATLQTRSSFCGEFADGVGNQMVEFPIDDNEYLKQFLLQYSLLRRKEGFICRYDSISAEQRVAPQPLSRRPNMPLSSISDMTQEQSQESKQPESSPSGAEQPGDVSTSEQATPGTGEVSEWGSERRKRPCLEERKTAPLPRAQPAPRSTNKNGQPKSAAAVQRERTGKLQMSDLSAYFHLPINGAAKALGICPTVLKKICRRNNMKRWPHRKIKSIERILSTLENTIAERDGEQDEGIRLEIESLKHERQQLCCGAVMDT